ncbi:MAG: hypothetical protein L0H83_05715, partial [Salinisphaera sp.]|nr:hypothetical protein [Salinisphaera sp.]
MIHRLPTWLRCLALLVLVAMLPARAGLFDHDEPEFLPVDQAFQLQATTRDDGNNAIAWRIADGYYLYRHAF